jgi:hypothetical protein
MIQSQPYSQYYGQSYSNQPSRNDPWTSQRPRQNPHVPRSGIAVFDPASDPVDYSSYVNFDVSNWANNSTDPNYLISPNEVLPPQDHAFDFHTTIQQDHQVQRPLEMRVTVPSPPPTALEFVNYNQSTPFFADDYMTDSQLSPSSPEDSMMGSSLSQLPLSPHPGSLPSPGGSDGMYSYQHSDPGMMFESQNSDQFDVKPAPPTAPLQMERSPTKISAQEMAFEASPEPERRARPSSNTKGSGRAGGRAVGTHLEPKVAKAAHDMRKIVACWHCVLQRDKVRFGFSSTWRFG